MRLAAHIAHAAHRESYPQERCLKQGQNNGTDGMLYRGFSPRKSRIDALGEGTGIPVLL
jgi:hypothetical protein